MLILTRQNIDQRYREAKTALSYDVPHLGLVRECLESNGRLCKYLLVDFFSPSFEPSADFFLENGLHWSPARDCIIDNCIFHLRTIDSAKNSNGYPTGISIWHFPNQVPFDDFERSRLEFHNSDTKVAIIILGAERTDAYKIVQVIEGKLPNYLVCTESKFKILGLTNALRLFQEPKLEASLTIAFLRTLEAPLKRLYESVTIKFQELKKEVEQIKTKTLPENLVNRSDTFGVQSELNQVFQNAKEELEYRHKSARTDSQDGLESFAIAISEAFKGFEQSETVDGKILNGVPEDFLRFVDNRATELLSRYADLDKRLLEKLLKDIERISRAKNLQLSINKQPQPDISRFGNIKVRDWRFSYQTWESPKMGFWNTIKFAKQGSFVILGLAGPLLSLLMVTVRGSDGEFLGIILDTSKIMLISPLLTLGLLVGNYIIVKERIPKLIKEESDKKLREFKQTLKEEAMRSLISCLTDWGNEVKRNIELYDRSVRQELQLSFERMQKQSLDIIDRKKMDDGQIFVQKETDFRNYEVFHKVVESWHRDWLSKIDTLELGLNQMPIRKVELDNIKI